MSLFMKNMLGSYCVLEKITRCCVLAQKALIVCVCVRTCMCVCVCVRACMCTRWGAVQNKIRNKKCQDSVLCAMLGDSTEC